MYLIPFGQVHKSYSIPDVEDTTAQYEFKKWLDERIERRKILDEIHQEVMKEQRETQ